MKTVLSALLLVIGSAASVVADCLSWAPDTVVISGRLAKETLPGPPNYESIANGDTAETYWILDLEEPVCVDGIDDLGQAHRETEVERIQLVLTAEAYEKYHALVGSEVNATGTLVSAVSGHHRTKVLLETAELGERER